ncbi:MULTISPECIES: dipeptide ABC transporter ATP-binding protein [unclassified Dermacoccus]|nr:MULTISPECIES: dipeptide ABC transporter ATP-binding protein [unclassified Dermacoccus]EFP59099.1 putative phosphonate C-P lyase system protein PhnK [Dermacoccus sp. Ellin185]TCJ91866.1 peptide/nickel transport system ATP-binding protein [Dermacoccus sp. SAI-028]
MSTPISVSGGGMLDKAGSSPLISVKDLAVSFPSEAGRVDAVRGVSFDIARGETLGIVGESGSGKSVTSTAIMGLLPSYAKVDGSITLEGEELLGRTDKEMSKVRGKRIGMVFQDPLSALTPIFTVGDQIVEAILIHQDITKAKAWEQAVALLDLVGIPNPKTRAKSFPHEFSGGMRQRVVIALAIANNPDLIIADEPTTALDVTVQAQVLEVLKKAQRETGAAVLMITHDLGVVAGQADRVGVMYAGRLIETGTADDVFAAPRMPYTIGLLGAVPRVDATGREALAPIKGTPPLLVDLPDACPLIPRCPIATAECGNGEPALRPVGSATHRAACIRADEISGRGFIGSEPIFPRPVIEDPAAGIPREERASVLRLDDVTKTFPLMKGAVLKRRVGSVYAVAGIDLDLREGETLGLVGESGSGKTTTLMEIMRMGQPETGDIEIAGQSIKNASRSQRKDLRRDIQMVFQDPMGALDPRMTVHGIISEPLVALGGSSKHEIDERVEELMALVGLNPQHSDRFPAAFSGGQRQRIGIARALATNPKTVVLDEPVSALDVSIQAGVINLLAELKARLGLSYLIVAHDLAVVRHISDRVAVMYLGKIVEVGAVDDVFERPMHPYTKALLSAIPVPNPVVERSRERILLTGDLPSPTSSEPGCRFVSRCPLYKTLDDAKQQLCRDTTPELMSVTGADHAHACHFAGGADTKEVH